MGHRISADGIEVDESKISVIKNWPTPKNIKEVRQFQGFCNYYRRFVQGYSKISHPLHSLLKKDQIFNWTDECENAFQTLKIALTSTPLLAFPDINKPFIFTTDASTTAIGYILSQKDDN